MSKSKKLVIESSSVSSSEDEKNIQTSVDDNSTDLDPELKYIPMIVQLQKNSSLILDNEPTVLLSGNIDYPQLEYGYHHYIHDNASKAKTIFKKFEGKKKVYLVLNKFEPHIDNYNDNIAGIAKQYFKLGDKIDIVHRSFFKLWEILMLFDLIDISNDKFVSVHLSEKYGSFVQAVMLYRDMYGKKNISNNDKYCMIPIHKDNDSVDNTFTSSYKKEKRIIMQKINDVSGLADLITADNFFDSTSKNIQEQYAFKFIINSIISAIHVQKKGGVFICRFYETFTNTSMKIIEILNELYDTVYFIKPLMSRGTSPEKYAVCVGFKYDNKHKDYKNIIKNLNTLNDTINKNKKDNIIDIFTDYKIPKLLIHTIIQINKMISNPRLKIIGEMLTYIDKENYFADEYHTRRDEQILCSKYWMNLFYPDDINKNKKIFKNIISILTKKAVNQIKKLDDKLVFVESQ